MKREAKKSVMTKTQSMPQANKKIVFSLEVPKASKVMLVGDFNNWNDKQTPLKKVRGALWEKELILNPGRYEYKFVIDGNWINDPKNSALVWNTFGTQNSVLEVL